MSASQPEPPVEIRLTANRTVLSLVWADGTRQDLPASELRAQSPSAGTRRLKIDGLEAAVPADLTIADVRLLGRYALNLVFSDGHDRGIYPWALLQEIGKDNAKTTHYPTSAEVSPANAIP